MVRVPLMALIVAVAGAILAAAMVYRVGSYQAEVRVRDAIMSRTLIRVAGITISTNNIATKKAYQKDRYNQCTICHAGMGSAYGAK